MTSTLPLLSSSSSSSSLPSSSPNNMNILNTSDGEISIIDENVADQMPAIHTSLEFLPDITGDIPSLVIEYCKAHAQNPNSTDPNYIQQVKNWDQQFVNEIDLNTLFELILAGKSLELPSLLDFTCQTMADMMKGRSMEEIRRNFNIKNHDFRSKNDEEIIRKFFHRGRSGGSRSSSSFSSSSSYPLRMFFCLPLSTLFERFKTMVSSFSSSFSKKMILLSSSEGKIFKVEENVALQSEMIKNLLEDSDYRVILLEVNTVILSKVIEYCQKHVEKPSNDDDDDDDDDEKLINWDTEFVMVDQKTLFDVINAANYLQIKSLLNFTCHFLAYMILEQHGMIMDEGVD
ncbi:uncharacterized protein LOC130823157 [Amaranthus tricolor]|uniref:uncharacterized protein LOC130823157 n=1 Tax=Amaranthus tricolor TaxID=29722 RepID=UPI002590811D|nr:uncharacterized protein LOC130823157 [Amaranthus tricolor]